MSDSNTSLEKEIRIRDERIEAMTKTIEDMKQAFIRQSDTLEKKTRDFEASLSYALRIQRAILPPDYYIQEVLPQSFIFYRPRDIVSGDFYFVAEEEGSVFFAAVDCTGHGVPGALMSVIGYNWLIQALREAENQDLIEIMKILDCGVSDTLRQTAGESDVKDSMELSICKFNPKTSEVEMSGSRRPYVIVKSGELMKEKTDNFYIGVNEDGVADEFTSHKYQLSKGDMIYLFSDGYPDQFGGDDFKKFMTGRLVRLLYSIYDKPLEEQHQIVADQFDLWMGDHHQTDDVLLIGVRV